MKAPSWLKLENIDKNGLNCTADIGSVSFLFFLLKRQIVMLKPKLWPYAIYHVFRMWFVFKLRKKKGR